MTLQGILDRLCLFEDEATNPPISTDFTLSYSESQAGKRILENSIADLLLSLLKMGNKFNNYGCADHRMKNCTSHMQYT